MRMTLFFGVCNYPVYLLKILPVLKKRCIKTKSNQRALTDFTKNLS